MNHQKMKQTSRIHQKKNKKFFHSSLIKLIIIISSSFLYSIEADFSFRSLWVLHSNLYNESSIDSFIDFANQNNINNLFVQVRSRGDALYDSEYVKKNNNILNKDFDPLEYIIGKANLNNIKIHIWFNTYILWSSKTPPVDDNHLFFTKHDWIESDYHGRTDLDLDLNSIRSPQWEGIYLSPNNPEVNDYLFSLIKEIMDNYEIDGIHLDYIRFQDDFYGFNKEGKKIFIEEYGFDPKNIYRSFNSNNDTYSEQWNNYNSKNITSLVERIYSYIDSTNYDVSLSAAVKPNPDEAKSRWKQDWISWINNDIIDFVVPMNYSKDINSFIGNIKSIKENVDQDKMEKIVMGISNYNQNEYSVTDKLILTKFNNFNQFCIFSYDYKKDEEGWYKVVRNNYNERMRFIRGYN